MHCDQNWKDSSPSTFGDILKAFRTRKRKTQQILASEMGVHRNTIGIWERGDFLPESKTIVLELARQLQLNEPEMRQLLEASLTAVSLHWSIPYQRNVFFTGREEILQQLHSYLCPDKNTHLSPCYALSGLGGIGKTQTAIEYTYRYASEYTAIFWVNAETPETMIVSFADIADLLNLSEKQEHDSHKIVAAVLRWLTGHRGWLLIYDNVQDIALIKPFFPLTRHQGYVLLTTRAQVTEPVALSLQLECLSEQEGALLLLRRMKRIAPGETMEMPGSEEQQSARAISRLLGELPLALDQAGAYILETGCSLASYLLIYAERHIHLLSRRGNVVTEHPESVATTFSLLFERLQGQDGAAADLLRLCSFLAPDAIPETLITAGSSCLGPLFQPVLSDLFTFNGVRETLRSLSLIQCSSANERKISLHRLLQTVIRSDMDEKTQQTWIERCVSLLNQAFPTGQMIVEQWDLCAQLVPHVQAIATRDVLLAIPSSEAAALFYKTARYLQDHAQYAEAEVFYQKTVQIQEHVLGLDHPDVATSLNSWGNLYSLQCKYTQAEPLYQRALHIREQVFGFDHPGVAVCLNNLANIYSEQGFYALVEPLYQRALHIRELMLEPYHFDIATSLNNLATLYSVQRQYALAEPLYQRALDIQKKGLRARHPMTVHFLNALANHYREQEKYEQAEPLYREALAICEERLGVPHPDTAEILQELATLYYRQDRMNEARVFSQRALTIRENILGPQHPHTQETLKLYTMLLHASDCVNETAQGCR